MVSGHSAADFRRRLLRWFDENARDLPWRQTQDPYAIWVSETMLQQTRVAVVIDYYKRFLGRFPTLASLAQAEESEVLALWSGLGYYRRARMLHQSARGVMAEYEGRIPHTSTGLARLPGVGVYTAAAVASIAFGENVAAIDGNVARVLARYCGQEAAGGSGSGESRRAADTLIDPQRPGDFNQAMMELGATVCLPKAPLCLTCPVRQGCVTQGEHVTSSKKKMLSRRIALGLVQRRQWPRSEVLLEQRAAQESQMPGMWELPRIQEGREAADTVLLTVRHSITTTNYYVTVYGVDAKEQKVLEAPAGERVWIPVRDLLERPLTGLTRKILKRLRVLPGYNGTGPAVEVGETLRQAAREFDAAVFGDD